VNLEGRIGRALARLEGRADPNPSYPPDAQRAERPPTFAPPPVRHADEPLLVPVDDPGLSARPPQQQPQPQPQPQPHAQPLPDLTSLARAERTESIRSRRLGPYTAAMAERDLLAAATRDEVLRAFFDFASQYFEYAALFVVHGDLAEGRDAHGPGAHRAKVQSIGVPLDLPSALARSRDAAAYELARLGGGLDAALAKDLERRSGPQVLMLPIRVRGRTVLVLYGDHGDSDVTLPAVGDVISFAPLVAAALERVIMQKKRGARAEPQPVLPSRPPVKRKRSSLPSPEARAEALASVLSSPPEPPRAFISETPVPPPNEPAPRDPSAPPSNALSRPLAPGRALNEKPDRQSAPPRSIAEALARPVISVGPAAAPEPRSDTTTPLGSATSRQPSLPPSAVDAGWEELATKPSDPPVIEQPRTKPGVGPRTAEATLVKPEDSPDISIEALSDEDGAEAALLSGERFSQIPTPPGGVPLAPNSRTAAHSARPLPPRGESAELALPTVIVDAGRDLKTLLDDLVHGDASAGDRLVEAGSAAVPVLVAAFPGPIEAPSSRRGSAADPPASECGPVLRTLARIGQKAIPFLVVRTNDADPKVRSFATRLLGELPSLESALAIARRFYDGDVEVRRSALAAARLLSNAPDALEALVAELGGMAEDRGKPTGVRLMAMETLAELRQAQAVSHLVRVLSDNPVDVVQAARRALVILARHDVGASPAAWAEWWRHNSARHRIEWLIDALTDELPEVRRAAGEELKAQTREYFGYYDDLPPAERSHAQQKYREWWEARGKARFRIPRH
jgi:HEAT repeat protein